jgi:hypothetical protein
MMPIVIAILLNQLGFYPHSPRWLSLQDSRHHQTFISLPMASNYPFRACSQEVPIPVGRTVRPILLAPETAYLDSDKAYASNEIAINWNAPLVYLAGAVEVLH